MMKSSSLLESQMMWDLIITFNSNCLQVYMVEVGEHCLHLVAFVLHTVS